MAFLAINKQNSLNFKACSSRVLEKKAKSTFLAAIIVTSIKSSIVLKYLKHIFHSSEYFTKFYQLKRKYHSDDDSSFSVSQINARVSLNWEVTPDVI